MSDKKKDDQKPNKKPPPPKEMPATGEIAERGDKKPKGDKR